MNGPDRRTILWSGLLLFGVIIVGVVAAAIFADPGEPDPQSARSTDRPPSIIVQPNSGEAPEDPGDRGGWEQLALLGLIVVVVGGIATVVIRGGGAKAKANRERWKAAAASGRDGAVG
jgi:hypothetical protein